MHILIKPVSELDKLFLIFWTIKSGLLNPVGFYILFTLSAGRASMKKDVRRKILASFMDRRTFKTFGRWIIVAKNGCIRLQRRSLYGCTSHAANIVYKVCICAPSGNACDTCNAPHSHTRPPFFFPPFPYQWSTLNYTRRQSCKQCGKQISRRSRTSDIPEVFFPSMIRLWKVIIKNLKIVKEIYVMYNI